MFLPESVKKNKKEKTWTGLDVAVSNCPVYLFICDKVAMYMSVHIIRAYSKNLLIYSG